MKKFFFTLALSLMAVVSVSAMSNSKIRQHARFLTDRMAYELDMTPMQYDDCYEINYDFICSIDRIMDDVCYGYRDAIDRYYTYLDYRNDDLRYILTSRQYAAFLNAVYFYRPVYTYLNTWNFRIYQRYSNRNFYYYDAPVIIKTYRGGHARTHYQSGYYGTTHRYNHTIHTTPVPVRGGHDYDNHKHSDFGVNHQDRGNTRPNNYSNPNQKNREQDNRYRNDRKENKNSPMINHRDLQNNNSQHTKPQSTRGEVPGQQNNNQSNNSNNNNNNRNNQNQQPHGGRR